MPRWSPAVCLLFAVLGCEPPGRALLGVYAVTGSAQYSIPGFGNASFPVADTFEISQGTSSELLLTDSAGKCVLPARTEGEGARLLPGASCSWRDNGTAFQLTLTRGSVLPSEGSLRLEMAGSVTATARGQWASGDFFQNATFTRLEE